MINHPPISVLFKVEREDAALSSLLTYLKTLLPIKLSVQSHLPPDLTAYDVVVSFSGNTSNADIESLTRFVEAGAGWLALVNLSEKALPSIFGAQAEPAGPSAELRVLFENFEHPLAVRLPDAVYLKGRYQALTKTADDSETILYADWHYSHKAVLTCRRRGAGRVGCTTLQDYRNPHLQRIIYRLLWQLAGRDVDRGSLGVGILGYAPSVGLVHGLGAEKTTGLKLQAVCDTNPVRQNEARQDFAEARTYDSAEKLVDDPDVDLVVIATPPNSHAGLSLQMMAGGKHVVCEKPLALNRRETEAMRETAARQKVHLSCHQNRRWDSDFLAIRQILAEGTIGDVFYMESFVGGYNHPCGYWHSDARVSGGASYDWGAHYLDWIVALMGRKIEGVIGTRHKRVWHDVTNADQERIQIRFSGGREAEFIHSDIAAVRKPKWYLLGSEGAVVGHWRDITSHEIDPILYYREHNIPATEMTPDIAVHRRHENGDMITLKPPIPEIKPYQFHSNLADHLLWGEPIAAPLEDSIEVVKILEAAARSMANGGKLEVLHDGSN